MWSEGSCSTSTPIRGHSPPTGRTGRWSPPYSSTCWAVTKNWPTGSGTRSIWRVVLSLFGFSLYAVLMAGAGALVSRLKEVSHVTYLVLSPLMAGYAVALLAPLADATQKVLPTVLSLFPLTAPVVMMMRLAAGPVPGWHLALAMALMAVCSCLTLRAAAGLFRAQYLLSGRTFSIARLFRLLVGRPS
jgi:ABC-2 type transport system permease protein